jgi:hypothetical protein
MDADEKIFKYCFGNYLKKLEFTPALLLTDHDYHLCLNVDSQSHKATVSTVTTPESASTVQIF